MNKNNFVYFPDGCVKIDDIVGARFINEQFVDPYYKICFQHFDMRCEPKYFHEFIKPHLLNDQFVNVSDILFFRKSCITAIYKYVYMAEGEYEVFYNDHHFFIPPKLAEEFIQKLKDS